MFESRLYHSSFRIESYSCKMAGQDKRLYKTLSQLSERAPTDLQALSPPQTYSPHSPSRCGSLTRTSVPSLLVMEQIVENITTSQLCNENVSWQDVSTRWPRPLVDPTQIVSVIQTLLFATASSKVGIDLTETNAAVFRQLSRSSTSDDGEGPLCDTISTKTLFYLISTLNASFNPDYDFTSAKSEEFSKEPSVQVRTALSDEEDERSCTFFKFEVF